MLKCSSSKMSQITVYENDINVVVEGSRALLQHIFQSHRLRIVSPSKARQPRIQSQISPRERKNEARCNHEAGALTFKCFHLF